jgi:hypothetical protein
MLFNQIIQKKSGNQIKLKRNNIIKSFIKKSAR